MWKRLEDRKILVLPEVWQAWEAGCIRHLDEIGGIVKQNNGCAIPVVDAEAIGKRAEILQKFVRGIKKSPDGISRVDEDEIFLEETARELTAHYLGNDIYKIALMADVYGPDPEPLPAENGPLICANISAIKEFIERLKNLTRQA